VNTQLQREVAQLAFGPRAPAATRIVVGRELVNSFLTEQPTPRGRPHIPVVLALEGRPDPRALAPLFTAGESWRAQRDGSATFIEDLTGLGRPSWALRIPDASDRAEVFPAADSVERRSDSVSVRNPLTYPLDQLLFMHFLPHHAGLLLHAAGVRRGAKAVVFLGRSGAGKSTIAQLLLAGGEVEGLSDDRVAVRMLDKQVVAFGTPWAGTALIGANSGAELCALVHLRQASENQLRDLTRRDALDRLLPLASILWYDEERSSRSLRLCHDLVGRIPSFELGFMPDGRVRPLLRALL
jgi:hypothetical protein